jgi:hypothetical protein
MALEVPCGNHRFLRPSARRAHPRLVPGTEVSCRLHFDDGEGWTGKVLELSPGAVSFLLPRPVASGGQFPITLTQDVSGFSCDLLLRVVHVTALPGGEYRVAGELLDELSPGEMQSLLS